MDNTEEPYCVQGTLVVEPNMTLTVKPGVEVRWDSWSDVIEVKGKMNVQGATLSGGVDLRASGGGQLSLTPDPDDVSRKSSVTSGDQVLFEKGSRGTVEDTDFGSVLLKIDSPGVTSSPVAVRNNRFSSSRPIQTPPALVPEFYDNEFLTAATIGVYGEIPTGATVNWYPIPNLDRYSLSGDLVVPSAATLTLKAVEVHSDTWSDEIMVYGTLLGQGVHFTGKTDLRVHGGGRLELTDNSLVSDGADAVRFHQASRGTVSNTAFHPQVDVDAESDIFFESNSFFGKVRATGDTDGVIDLRNNYWGSCEATSIENKIIHKVDNPSLPLVLFEPFLCEPPEIGPAPDDVLATTRQSFELSRMAFDGNGDDVTVVLGHMQEGQSTEILVGNTVNGMRSLGTFTNDQGKHPWVLTLDIGEAGLDRAEEIVATSSEPLSILFAGGRYFAPSYLKDYEWLKSGAHDGYVPSPADYYGVAQVYRWDYASDRYRSLSTGNLNDIEWQKKTIILTHGWNSSLYAPKEGQDSSKYADFMNLFASDFEVGRSTDELDNYNILAIDWFDNGSELGSNPNGKSLVPGDIVDGPLVDATKSANNGIYAAQVLAQQLLNDAGLKKNELRNVMLVGHSNGAGFMGTLATSLAAETEGQVAELVALDAPWATPSFLATERAAESVDYLSNYYLPCQQSTAERFAHKDFNPLTCGVGAPMMPINLGNTRNLELNRKYTDFDFPNKLPHSQVAWRYADTADNRQHSHSWGYRVSPFETGQPNEPEQYHGIWQEGETEGEFKPLEPSPALTAQIFEQVEGLGSGLGGWIGDAVRSVWDESVRVAEDIKDAVTGENVSLLVPGGTWGARDPVLHGKAQSPIIAAFDARVPDDAVFLSYELSVLGPVTDEALFVSLGDEVIQKVDLKPQASSGGSAFDVFVEPYAGTTQTVTFFVPAEDDSSVELMISSIDFLLDVNEPPSGVSALGDLAVEENRNGATVAFLRVEDPNPFDDHQFVVSDPRFQVVDNELRLKDNVSVDYEREASIDMTVTATDDGGLSSDAIEMTIDVLDGHDPITLSTSIADWIVVEDTETEYTIPSDTFQHEGAQQKLSYSAALSDGSPLPQWLKFNESTRTFIGTPDYQDVGEVTVSVTAKDNSGARATDDFLVTVQNVNDPPTVCLPEDPTIIDEDAEAQVVNLSCISPGPGEDEPVTLSAAADDENLVEVIELEYVPGESTARLWLLPVENMSGNTTVTVTITDAGDDGKLNTPDDNLSFELDIPVTVLPVNDDPTLDPIPDPDAINEDAPLQTIDLSGISAGPYEDEPVRVTAASDNPADKPALTGEITVDYASGDDSGTLSYAPLPDQYGSAKITVTVEDAGLDKDFEETDDNASFSRSFEVEVRPVNDPPVPSDDSYDGLENQQLSVAAPGVLGNDTDADGDALAARLLDPPEHGSLDLNADGGFTYSPDSQYNRQDSFGYRVSDGIEESGMATVTITLETAYPWHNGTAAVDVNDDGYVSSIDALLVINELNTRGSGRLPEERDRPLLPPFLDVSRDAYLSPVDALEVIDHLNTEGSGKVEGEDLVEADTRTNDVAFLSASILADSGVPGGDIQNGDESSEYAAAPAQAEIELPLTGTSPHRSRHEPSVWNEDETNWKDEELEEIMADLVAGSDHGWDLWSYITAERHVTGVRQ
ncbi:MAG: Ig-like domain-containing protein [Pirellulaceae bacterium]